MRPLCLMLAWLCVGSAWAINSQELITTLKSRLREIPQGGKLIQSYVEKDQSYIYDQALAIIALSREKDKAARELLLALKTLQLKDGSLYFSYYLDGKSPYPEEGDKRFAGAIAWAALASAHYQENFGSDEFVAFNRDLLTYLKKEMRPLTIAETSFRAIRFAPTDIATSTWNETDVAALEHNLDAYAAFRLFNRLNPDKKFDDVVPDLKRFILALWDPVANHFWSGAAITDGKINQQEYYLDNQSWTLLVLEAATVKELNAREALRKNCELQAERDGVTGFMDSKPARRPSKQNFVWSEGTLGQILAMKRLEKLQKEPVTCEGVDAAFYLKNVLKMKAKDGGIAYATASENPDFTTASSVAGTAWLYFVQTEFNPFQLD